MTSQSETIPYAIGLTLGASAVILFLLFGSVVIPIKAVIMTLLSITASFGALVFIFQDGNLADVLGFTTPGFTIAGNPIIMFSVLFGLSMDYEVLLLSRIQEAYRRTGDNTASVAEGLAKTAGVITGAALIMVTVFAAFALAESITIKSIGVGMAIAVLIDATIVRVLLVPATMRLMGRWNWWAPGPLGRFADRLGLRVTWRRSRSPTMAASPPRRGAPPSRPSRSPTRRRRPRRPSRPSGRRRPRRASAAGHSDRSRSLTGSLSSANRSSDPAARRARRAARRGMSAAVMSMSVIGSAATTTQRVGRRCGVDRRFDRLAERLGVREEERRVPAEQDQALEPLRVRVAGDVVVALDALDPTEDRRVRTPRAPEEGRERDADRRRRCPATTPTRATPAKQIERTRPPRSVAAG